ncbi:oxygen-independent coproporphyrinogen III oxidase [Algiphilus sp. W345]|uniref:Coproporphyrinogen-III oxidase n=1 Tax=Banduia mediterranea TaxID=3075609 RepID=A0ABU2WMH4_9GAMM|nr:oxygen-independent coproporphyrinogen III oxidase [Algiphilus sp. W345]MDT0499083.1 oxygen-independent coproporphyrinogen III oxidase [Algiphilus sp. W345]
MTTAEPTSSAALPADLLAREMRGPRYTSYPTALAFDTRFGVADWCQAVRASARGGEALSLYVHIPFCASNCFYCGCNRVISRSRTRIRGYLESLLHEIEMQARLMQPPPEVLQLHLGGGTPNSLTTGELAVLLEALRNRFRFAPDERLECSMEVDPRLATVDDIDVWRELGFNRLSFGVQDVDAVVQTAINRRQSSDHLAELTAAARQAGFSSLNYDLVYGLPMQSPARFEATLDFVLAQRPDRVAAYHYAHLPARFPAQRAIDEQTLPNQTQRQWLRERIHQRLCQAGYVAIGLDHYALPGDELARAFAGGRLHRNFQGYSTLPDCELLGLGASAISRLGGCYAQNEATEQGYRLAVDTGHYPVARGYRLTDEDRLRAAVIESIMCRGEADFSELPSGRFAPELERLRALDPAQTWLECGPWGLRVSEAGRSLLRVVAMVFDAHLGRAEVPATRYSRLA